MIAYPAVYPLKYNLGYRFAVGYGGPIVSNPATTPVGQSAVWPSIVQKRFGFTLYAGTFVTPPPP
jgi:hypothetical protein